MICQEVFVNKYRKNTFPFRAFYANIIRHLATTFGIQ